MYCRNCGSEMNKEAVVCVKCGLPKGKGNKYCPNCGVQTHPEAVVCVVCGSKFLEPEDDKSDKSKLTAGLLGIFLGTFGVHNFYLGYTAKAIVQLLLGTVGGLFCGIGTVVSGIWGLIEGILIICGNMDKDSDGKTLQE